MSLAASLLLAAATTAAQPGGHGSAEADGQGVQVERARIAARILRPAVLKGGVLASSERESAPRHQVVRRATRVTYEFE